MRMMAILGGAAAALIVLGCAAAPADPPSGVAAASLAASPSAPAESGSPAATVAASPTRTPSPTVGDEEAWIAFQTGSSAGYGIHLVRPDGSGFHKWPAAIPGTHEHPDWSPDADLILLNSVPSDKTEDVWIAGADGSDAHVVVDCVAPCMWADEAAWSPDGATVAFQRLVRDGAGFVSTLELLDVATGRTSVVLTMPEREVVLAPRWSPTGDRIVVEVVRLVSDDVDGGMDGGAVGVVDLRADTPAVDRLTDWESFANNPDWSRDDLLVYVQPSGPDKAFADLVVVKPDGTGSRPITALGAEGGAAVHPAFTPDGERVLFVLTRPGTEETVMATVGIDGSGLASATGADYQDGTHPRLRPTD